MSPESNQPASPASSGTRSIQRRAVPVWLPIFLLLLLYWSMLYFDQHGGWFSQEVYAPYRNIAEVESWQPPKSGPSELGRAVYHRPTCVACHQSEGQGSPGQFPPLVHSEWVNEPEPGRLIRLVLHGMVPPFEHDGQMFGGTMVPWKESLNDIEIAAVLTFIRQNSAWGNNAPEVSPERVREVREKTKERSQPYSQAELLAISVTD